MDDDEEDWQPKAKPTRPPKPSLAAPNTPRPAAERANDPKKIICSCPPEQTTRVLTRAQTSVITCTRCHHLQHTICMSSLPNENNSNKSPPHCNNCQYDLLAKQVAAQRRRVERLTEIVQRKRTIAQTFYAVQLWKHYCSLPDSQNIPQSEKVNEATRTKYDDGRMIPVSPAPQSWIAQVQRSVAGMMENAGDEMRKYYLASAPTLAFADLSILVHWRDLAMWMVHRGPYRKEVAKLGVLAEVLGFVEKGTFWKGEDAEDDGI